MTDAKIVALDNSLKNLRAIDAQLTGLSSDQYILSLNTYQSDQQEETRLSDDTLTGWREVWLRMSSNLTPRSAILLGLPILYFVPSVEGQLGAIN
ncbi:hypothetical protein XNA1_650001 [Xenorhabdus nematophila str. Anatoliense]|nr:hypothetical protein XNA1_4530001 [Xenorhabdus nematophila str. Anatoliense]CEE95752.1 hypothetical protein XNA1_650001 [Xenorhabdus nematophila str. Anatoliense]